MLDLREMWDFSDPVASEARFRQAVGSASERDAEVLRTQIARALGLQDRFSEAEGMLSRIAFDDDEIRVRVALERGRLLRSSGDPVSAAPWFERAVSLANAAGLEELEVDALHMVALVREGEDQVTTTEAALELTRSSSAPEARRWEASLLHNLGMALADLGRWTEALGAFDLAVERRRAEGDEQAIRFARWAVAWALRNLGRRDEALSRQLALKAELLHVGLEDRDVDEELAILQQDHGDAEAGSG